jgi:hypothetical protein
MAFISVFSASCGLLPNAEPLPPPLIPRVAITETLKSIIVEKGDITEYARFNGHVTTIRQHDLHLTVASAVLSEHNINQLVSRDNISESAQIKLIIQQNMRVKAGDILAVFTNEDIEKQAGPLRRAVELARIGYNAAVRENEEANAYYTEFKGIAERDRQNAAENYASAQTLYQAGGISKAELVEAKTNYEDAVLKLEQSLRQAQAAAENKDGVHKQSINLAAAEEDLQIIQEKIEALVIRAPVDGIIIYYNDLFIGSTYTSDQLLFTVAEESAYYVTVVLSEAQMMLDNPFVLGAEVEMSARDNTGSGVFEIDFKGMVVSITNDQKKAAATNENMIMIEAYEWPEQVDLTTSQIRVNAVKASSSDVVVIPRNAVYMVGNYYYVRVVEEGVSWERAVEIGVRNDTEVEIISGLEPGEEIALKR